MKILILADDFPPYSRGGAGFSTFDLGCAFQKKGHQVFVITTCQKKSDEGKTDYQELKVFSIYARYPARWRAYLSLYNPQTISQVRRLLQEIKPDIVHANNIHYYLSYYCLKLAKKYSRGLFLTARDAMLFNYGKLATKQYLEHFDPKTSCLDLLKQAKKRYNPFRNIIIRHYLKSVDKIFAISYSLKEALNQNGIGNVEVIYNGIDVADWQISQIRVEEFKKKYKMAGKKIIFCAGRTSALKGLEQINQVMAKVKEEIPAAVLLIAGREGIGWLEREELKAAYFASDIVVIPSIYLDPFNRTNIEAMACKKPVVGTKYGGTPEIVQDGVTGFVVNPFDVELMAAKIIDLLKNPQQAGGFGEAGYQRVRENFNLEKQADKYLDWFKSKVI